MITKKSLTKTFKLINQQNITVISSKNCKLPYNLFLSLNLAKHIDNIQYYPPKTIDEITAVITNLINQFKQQNKKSIQWLGLNLSYIAKELTIINVSKLLQELKEISVANNFKIIVMLPYKTSKFWEGLCSSVTEKQVLLLEMQAEPSIQISVANQKENNIFYEYDKGTETEPIFLKEKL